jgi:hypothetical protein
MEVENGQGEEVADVRSNAEAVFASVLEQVLSYAAAPLLPPGSKDIRVGPSLVTAFLLLH